jgi:triosephosphate isomerase
LDIAATTQWALAVGTLARSNEALLQGSVRLFVLPSLPALPAVQRALSGAPVEIGAQDLHWDDRGAYTGAVSGTDLRDVGCRYVEVGHAERRRHFGDDTSTIRDKLSAAFRNNLTPVLCIGERELCGPEQAAESCVRQLRDVLAGQCEVYTHIPEVIVAYEPDWAIGEANPAGVSHIVMVTAALRAHLNGETWIDVATVIYGGSARPGLLTDLGRRVDGLFLGRFAHDPAELERVISEASLLS